MAGVAKNKTRFIFFWKTSRRLLTQTRKQLLYAQMLQKYQLFEKLYKKHLTRPKFKKKFIKAKKNHDIIGTFIKIIDNTGADMHKLYVY